MNLLNKKIGVGIENLEQVDEVEKVGELQETDFEELEETEFGSSENVGKKRIDEPNLRCFSVILMNINIIQIIYYIILY